MFLGGQFIANEVLDVLGLSRSCELAVSDFLEGQTSINCSQTGIKIKEEI